MHLNKTVLGERSERVSELFSSIFEDFKEKKLFLKHFGRLDVRWWVFVMVGVVVCNLGFTKMATSILGWSRVF